MPQPPHFGGPTIDYGGQALKEYAAAGEPDRVRWFGEVSRGNDVARFLAAMPRPSADREPDPYPVRPSQKLPPSPPPAKQPSTVAQQSPAAPGGGVSGKLACIRQKESGGNYRASNGTHFGAYQFSVQTWASVGGSGNPAAAPAAEQDARAQALAARSGFGPWTTAGSC